MQRTVKYVAPLLVASVLIGLCATASHAQVTSTVFESQMYNPQSAMFQNPYNYIGTPTVSSGTLTYDTDPGGGAYTNTAGSTISVDSAGGTYGSFSVSDISVNATTDYGSNHAEASVGSFNDSYFSEKAMSSWTDTFNVDSTLGNSSTYFIGDTVQFVFSVDTTGNSQITGMAAASLNVSASALPVTGGVSGFSTNSTGLNATYSKYDATSQGYFDPTPITSDTYSFSGGGSATLVTQQYSLDADATITPTVTLMTQVNPGLYLAQGQTGSGTADFSQTASITGINIFNANGQLIDPSDYTISSLSGANYPFQGGVAPETSTEFSFGIGILVLLGSVLGSQLISKHNSMRSLTTDREPTSLIS